MQFDSQASWLKYLDPGQQELVEISFFLSQEFSDQNNIQDFSFIVFPMAKAYEGFLKKVLLDLNLITQEVYYSRRFRIGRALNPDVSPNQRDQWWLFDDLGRIFNQGLAQEIWQTWLQCRNHVFHYFPNGEQKLNFAEAMSCLNKMQTVMKTTVELIEERHEKKANQTKKIES